jgi:hypothetical protein
MCNPPFYGSKEEVTKAAEDKEFDPSAVYIGLVYAGLDNQLTYRLVCMCRYAPVQMWRWLPLEAKQDLSRE